MSIIPYFILLAFLVYALRKPVYLLSIPFLLAFRQSIYFEKVKIFTIPGRYSPDILLLIWMIIIWLLLKLLYNSPYISGKRLYEKNRISLMDYSILGLMILSVVNVVRVFYSYIFLGEVIEQFIILFSLFVGYFLLKDALRYFNPITLSKFLFGLVLVNSFASVLYIIHQGLHITIYQSEEYYSGIFGDDIITRTFTFMPLLWFFSISYLIVFRKPKSILFPLLIIINTLALFISYTRSFIVITLFIVFLYYFLISFKKNDFSVFIKNILIVSVVAVILFFAASKIFPSSTGYFINRIVELRQNPNDITTNSMLYRFSQTGNVIRNISAEDILIGYGPITEDMSPLVTSMRMATWDLVWTGVIFRWGIIGLLLFISVYGFALKGAFGLFLKGDDITSKLALLFLLFIVSQLIESFVSSTFMSSNRYAIGLWYLGMFSALLLTKYNQDGKSV